MANIFWIEDEHFNIHNHSLKICDDCFTYMIKKYAMNLLGKIHTQIIFKYVMDIFNIQHDIFCKHDG